MLGLEKVCGEKFGLHPLSACKVLRRCACACACVNFLHVYVTVSVCWLQIQFAKEGNDWNNCYFREQDQIVNESALYPRPRMNKRSVSYDNRTMDAVKVVGLPPNATVLIQVRVLTKYYVGPASDPVRVTTPEGGMRVALCSSLAEKGVNKSYVQVMYVAHCSVIRQMSKTLFTVVEFKEKGCHKSFKYP